MSGEPNISVSGTYLRNIERKVEGLKVLVDISSIISSTLDLNDLMPLVMDRAKQVMDAEACSILFYNKETNKLEFEIAMCDEESRAEILKKRITLDMGQGIAGWVAQNLEPLVIDDVKKDGRFYQDADKLTGFTTESIIAVPLIGRGGLIGVAEILNPRNKDYDPEIFRLLCKQFAIAIENALFYRESMERERLRQELEIAAAIQRSFLPESPVFVKGNLTVSAVTIPAKNVGGDLYDFVEPSANKAGVLIGDVSGKGISAALYMSKLISDFRYTARLIESPQVVMERLNTLLSKAPRGMFLTSTYMIIDTITGHLDVSVAGHPPFILLADGEVRVMGVRSGPPLGIVPEEYPVSSLTLKKGDRLFLVTDGVFEAKNKRGERIGFENLVDFIRERQGDGQLLEEIIEYVKGFSEGGGLADDLTMVEVKWKG